MVITDYDELYGVKIPDTWSVEKLEPKIGNVKSGKRLPKGYYVVDVHTNHPYIRVIDMRQGYVETNDLKYVPDEAFPAIQNYRIYKDDIYISVAGTLGIVGQIPEYLDGANLTENANRITNIKCNTKFLMYWLMSSIIQNTISQTQTLGAQPKLALTRIRNFPVILPPTKEQEEIAEALSTIDTLITDLQKLIRKKKDIRQGTMQMLVTGKKRLSGFDGDWQTTTLDKLCRLVTKQTGFDYSAEIKPSLMTAPQIGTIPFIQNKDFEAFDINYNTDFYIPYDVAEKYPKILLDEVCLLISISGR
ncbi:MAG: restriction endonuclease subunit S, partial [Lachnospiraceae bacterium]|nr:restriction endonuclease subunit S [Lachnospiraceae bacterium]